LILGCLLEAAVTESMKMTVGKSGRVRKIKETDRILWKACGLLTIISISAGIAILSEVLKIYIPGRHLDWPEVGLNLVCAWLGCGGMCIVEKLSARRKHA